RFPRCGHSAYRTTSGKTSDRVVLLINQLFRQAHSCFGNPRKKMTVYADCEHCTENHSNFRQSPSTENFIVHKKPVCFCQACIGSGLFSFLRVAKQGTTSRLPPAAIQSH